MKQLIIFCLLISACTHKSHSHSPGEMNAKFLDPNINVENWDKDFEDANRDVIVNREAIIKSLDLKKGESVVDVGAGTGSFLLHLSKLVGDKGKVTAIEISPSFVEFMKTKINKLNLKNSQAVLGELKSTTLKDKTQDMVFCVDTFHHFDNPELMLNDFKRILKPKGRLVVVDFMKNESSRDWVKKHIKLTKDEYISLITKNGFSLKSDSKISFKENFMLTFVLN